MNYRMRFKWCLENWNQPAPTNPELLAALEGPGYVQVFLDWGQLTLSVTVENPSGPNNRCFRDHPYSLNLHARLLGLVEAGYEMHEHQVGHWRDRWSLFFQPARQRYCIVISDDRLSVARSGLMIWEAYEQLSEVERRYAAKRNAYWGSRSSYGGPNSVALDSKCTTWASFYIWPEGRPLVPIAVPGQSVQLSMF